METCVYCGKRLFDFDQKAHVKTRDFNVCSDACRKKTEAYVKKDRKYKTLMYFLILGGGIGFAASAFFGGEGPYKMLGAYIGQLAAGLAFLLMPYPISSFETFRNTCIRSVTRTTRLIGFLLTASAAVFLALMFF